MIVVYGAPPTRALRPIWMMEEMGLAYEVRAIDMPNRWEDPTLMGLNPGGFVPVLVDGDVTMLESCAMLEFLGQRYGPSPLVLAPSDPNYARYLQFMHFGEASLGAILNILTGSRVHAPEGEKDNWGSRFAVDLMVRRCAVLEDRLKTSDFIVGNDFSAADISVGYSLGLAWHLGFEDRLAPIVLDYARRLRDRPAYRRAEAKGH